ncbi:MAG TPA: efflux RND transporter periplasmic adaptor subunit [Noviherbaspirillum sp.]|nr:efflux RND transporter periplasmic adaptor subunit [Noviherbaspirillum sp.]
MKANTFIYALALATALAPAAAMAHGGEDHGDEKPAAAPANALPVQVGNEAPARLADGSVFLPKASQNLLGIRTLQAHAGEVSQTLELKGHVRADPSAGGQVQATQMGRIAGTRAGLPALGQTVKAGDVLAWLEPVTGGVELANQRAQLAQIDSQLQIAERRVARNEQLEGTVPQKEIDAAKAELQALRRQKAAIGGGLTNRLPLKAPVSGVISNVAVVAGQVVDARQTVFEIVNPQRLIVEALAYDARALGDIASVSGSTASGEKLNLQLLGRGVALRDQALPVQFRIVAPYPALAVGEPVNAFVQLKQARKGAVVPVAAVTRGASGEQMVWLHTGAERFAPRKVQAQNLDGARMVVTEGLAGAERVVVQGVASLAQVR